MVGRRQCVPSVNATHREPHGQSRSVVIGAGPWWVVTGSADSSRPQSSHLIVGMTGASRGGETTKFTSRYGGCSAVGYGPPYLGCTRPALAQPFATSRVAERCSS